MKEFEAFDSKLTEGYAVRPSINQIGDKRGPSQCDGTKQNLCDSDIDLSKKQDQEKFQMSVWDSINSLFSEG